MRAFLLVGLLIACCAPADAQTAARDKALTAHLRTRQHVTPRPDQGPAPAARFSVPGWSDEQTQQWLDNATSCESCG
jgi:hypothetical protein